MTMSVTMLITVMGESGSLLNSGSTYTVTKAFGAALVGGKRATDTYGVLTPASSENKPYLALDTSGNVTGLVGPGGGNLGLPTPTKISEVPYLMASFGDSRALGEVNITSPDFSVTSALMRATRLPAMLMGEMGDVEYSRNYGVSGDLCANWGSTTRAISGGGSGTASITNLCNETALDFVAVQYGINDVISWNGTSPVLATFVATQVAYHKAYITEILKSGKKVVWESINPCTLANYSSIAAKQTAVDQINAAVSAFIAGFPLWAVYADTATSLKDGTGYANTAYYADGTHFNRIGALLSAGIVATAARAILPKKAAISYAALPVRPNFIDWLSPAVYTVAEAGAVSALVTTTGVANGEFYIQHTYTPTAGTRFRMATSGHIGTATPRYSVGIGDVVQGSARVVVDDGAGGAPNVSAIDLRHRMYGASGVFQSTGDLADLSLTPSSAIDLRMITPRVASAMASASVADVGLSQGYTLELFVTSPSTSPVRVRIYSPQLRRVA